VPSLEDAFGAPRHTFVTMEQLLALRDGAR
jgi:hypothetical protein